MQQNGAEATLTFSKETVTKERIAKKYRLAELDDKLRASRTKREINILTKAPVRVPKIISSGDFSIVMERINGAPLKEKLTSESASNYAKKLAIVIRKLHEADIMHGDLTTSNILTDETDEIVLIDFGLSIFTKRIEDKAVDLHVLRETISASHPLIAETFWEEFTKTYADEKVLERLAKVETRGRYKAKH